MCAVCKDYPLCVWKVLLGLWSRCFTGKFVDEISTELHETSEENSVLFCVALHFIWWAIAIPWTTYDDDNDTDACKPVSCVCDYYRFWKCKLIRFECTLGLDGPPIEHFDTCFTPCISDQTTKCTRRTGLNTAIRSNGGYVTRATQTTSTSIVECLDSQRSGDFYQKTVPSTALALWTILNN